MKKIFYSALCIAFSTLMIISCGTQPSRTRAKFGGSSSSSPAYSNAKTSYNYSDGVKKIDGRSAQSIPASHAQNISTTSASFTSKGQAGLLTGGVTNDLGKWDLWNDMVKSQLDAQIKLWKMHPYQRYAVMLQTENGMPVVGANITLLNTNKKPIWEAVSDNTGSAQLWSGMFEEAKDTAVSIIEISYLNQKFTIDKPIKFENGMNTKKLSVPYKKPNKVDIAFVVDATGSMGDEIDFLKEELYDIISKTQKKYEEIDLSLGSVFYRCKGNSYTTRSISLTGEHSAVLDFIKAQDDGEGGTEAVEVAFEDALNKLNWHDDARTRLMFFILDEPSGYTTEIITKLHTCIQLAAKKGIKVIPVVASGSGNASTQDRNLEFLMRTAAVATNGNYIFMTDDSGIGGEHTTPIIDNFDVESLNEILVRTIDNYIYMPEKVIPTDEIVQDTLLVDNTIDLLNDVLDKYSVLSTDSAIAVILPYTDYTTIEELNKHKPIQKLDTAAIIKDAQKEIHTLKIYPNPSTGMIKAEFNTNPDFLFLADLNGKILQRISTNGQTLLTMDLNEFPSGIYLVQYPDEEKWISAKIVLQK